MGKASERKILEQLQAAQARIACLEAEIKRRDAEKISWLPGLLLVLAMLIVVPMCSGGSKW